MGSGAQEFCFSVTLEDMPEAISEYGIKNNINHVILRGNRNMSNVVAQEIVEYSKGKYNFNNMIVEVI